MKKKSIWERYARLFLLIGALALAVLIIWVAFGDMLPQLFRLLRAGDEEAIETYLLEEGGFRAILAIILLAILQVVSIVFPGFAIQIASGIIYGWWKAFLMCYSGFVLGNILVFAVSRRFRTHIGELTPEKKSAKKSGFDLNAWIRDKMKSARPGFVVAFVNLLPILPNGIIPYIAAGSPIRFRSYLKAIMVSCWIQILINCIAGHFLIQGQYLFMTIALGFQIALLIFVTVKRKWLLSLIPTGK